MYLIPSKGKISTKIFIKLIAAFLHSSLIAKMTPTSQQRVYSSLYFPPYVLSSKSVE